MPPDKNRGSLASRVRSGVEPSALPTPDGLCASGRVHIVEEETAPQRKNLHSLRRPSYASKASDTTRKYQNRRYLGSCVFLSHGDEVGWIVKVKWWGM